MNTKDGYSKKSLNANNVLLANGGHKAINEFFTKTSTGLQEPKLTLTCENSYTNASGTTIQYIGNGDNYQSTSFYFGLVVQDSYYKPWRIRLRITTYCLSQETYKSISWIEWYGHGNVVYYQDFNDYYAHCHLYGAIRTLYDSRAIPYGVNIALGVCIRYSNGYTNTNFLRSFKIDFYECDNCTFTMFDTMVRFSDLYSKVSFVFPDKGENDSREATYMGTWSSSATYMIGDIVYSTASTEQGNYYRCASPNTNVAVTNSSYWLTLYVNSGTYPDMINRGLQETGDANTTTLQDYSNPYLKVANNTGSLRLNGTCLFGFSKAGEIESFGAYGTGRSTTIRTTTNADRYITTAGIDYTKGIWYIASSSSYAQGAVVGNTINSKTDGIDFRYTFNCIAASGTPEYTLGLRPYKMIYLRGYLKDGLFYFAPFTVTYNSNSYSIPWILEIPTTKATYTASSVTYDCVYWLLGYTYYNSSYPNNCYLVTLFLNNPLYDGDGNVITSDSSASGSVPSHTHGNITNDGKLGTVGNRLAITTTDGLLTNSTHLYAVEDGYPRLTIDTDDATITMGVNGSYYGLYNNDAAYWPFRVNNTTTIATVNELLAINKSDAISSFYSLLKVTPKNSVYPSIYIGAADVTEGTRNSSNKAFTPISGEFIRIFGSIPGMERTYTSATSSTVSSSSLHTDSAFNIRIYSVNASTGAPLSYCDDYYISAQKGKTASNSYEILTARTTYWGTAATNYVPLCIKGTSKNLSLNGHTHSSISSGSYTFGINTNSSSLTIFKSNVDIYATNFYVDSDIRIKNILKYINLPIESIAKLPTFEFYWKNSNNTNLQCGTSAQAVLEILPTAVSGKETLTLNYSAFGVIASITAAREIVELKKLIEELKSEIKTLKNG